MLNADVKIDDKLKTKPQIDLAKIDDEHDNNYNYGTVLMREIVRYLYDEHQMYNRPPVSATPVVVNKPSKIKKFAFAIVNVRNQNGNQDNLSSFYFQNHELKIYKLIL